MSVLDQNGRIQAPGFPSWLYPLQVTQPITTFLTTKDGKLNHCQELTPDGKKFVVWIIHLLESQPDVGKDYYIDGQNTQLIFF